MVPVRLLPAIFFLLSCQSPPQVSGDSDNVFLQEDMACEWNESRTFQLCKQEQSSNSFPNPIDIEIFDKAGNSVMKRSLSSGYAKWIGDTDVEYFQTPGMMPQGVDRDDLVQVYQIRTKETISKKEYLKIREE